MNYKSCSAYFHCTVVRWHQVEARLLPVVGSETTAKLISGQSRCHLVPGSDQWAPEFTRCQPLPQRNCRVNYNLYLNTKIIYQFNKNDTVQNALLPVSLGCAKLHPSHTGVSLVQSLTTFLGLTGYQNFSEFLLCVLTFPFMFPHMVKHVL